MRILAPINEIKPAMTKIDERVQHDIQIVAKFYKDDKVSTWWSQYFTELQSDEEKEREAAKPLIEDLIKLKVVEENSQANEYNENEVLDGLEDINANIPKVLVGSNTCKCTELKDAVEIEEIQKGTVVAVYTDDIDREFYIMKITKPRRRLLKPAKDG